MNHKLQRVKKLKTNVRPCPPRQEEERIQLALEGVRRVIERVYRNEPLPADWYDLTRSGVLRVL